MSTEAKRPRMEGNGKSYHGKGRTDKRNYYARAGNDSRRKTYLEPGQRGFLVTCNMRERECVQDSYRLLNEVADELYGKLGEPEKQPAKADGSDGEEEEEDISIQVQKQVEEAKSQKKQFRFESVDTGAKNCCFIKTVLKDPKELALKILREAAETKKQRSRNILRMMPIEVVTKANLKDIMDAAGRLFDEHFLKEPKTFAIIFNRRFNNSIERDSVIDELAGLITAKNRENKANLKNPDLAIIVEVIKGLCLISVVPEYFQLRKYNLMELCAKKEDESKSQEVAEKKDQAENSQEEPEGTGSQGEEKTADEEDKPEPTETAPSTEAAESAE